MVRNNKAFTLIELMVVIVIIGILAALAIPRFTEASTKAKISEIPIILSGWDHAVIARHQEVGLLPVDNTEIVFDSPNGSKWFAYTFTYAVALATANAEVAPGITVGSFIAGAGDAQSNITNLGVITHDPGGFGVKYLGNWN